MNTDNQILQSGYYLITLRPTVSGPLLHSNNERALVISLLQDRLTARSLLEMPPIHKGLASHIDLLAFSILKEAVQLIVFSIAESSAITLAESIVRQLTLYHSEYSAKLHANYIHTKPSISLRRLIGPYDALNMSVLLHSSHTDWEYDRYSSIGFYLHDRRGDWVRLWRLAHLYENNVSNYRQLLHNCLQEQVTEPMSSLATTEQFAT